MDMFHAQQNLAELLTEHFINLSGHESKRIRPIYVQRIANVRNSTGSHVRYLLVSNGTITDITGRVARALGRFYRYNDRTGNYLVKGGDGTDAINSLSSDLFGDINAIPVFKV